MRLITFKAATLAEAMRRLRDEAGADAMLLGAQEDASGAQVTAALDTPDDDLGALLAPVDAVRLRDEIVTALVAHGVPSALRQALEADLARPQLADPALLLATALGRQLRFSQQDEPGTGAVAIMGPPGAGKTTAVARLAVAARLKGQDVIVASLDCQRAGGIGQLKGLMAPLGIEPVVVDSRTSLQRLVEQHAGRCRIVIDTAAINAFQDSELATAASLLSDIAIEPVIAFPAGLDSADTVELCHRLVTLGAKRLIVTRLDAARRLGAVVAAGAVGPALAEASISPIIGRPMLPLTAMGLARLLLRSLGARVSGNGPAD